MNSLLIQAELRIQAAYGSAKDIAVYQQLGVEAHQIFVVGKVSKKQHKEAVVRVHVCY